MLLLDPMEPAQIVSETLSLFLHCWVLASAPFHLTALVLPSGNKKVYYAFQNLPGSIMKRPVDFLRNTGLKVLKFLF